MKQIRWNGRDYTVSVESKEIRVLSGTGSKKGTADLTQLVLLGHSGIHLAIGEDSDGTLYRFRRGRGWSKILEPVKPESRQLAHLVERWKGATT